MGDTRQARPPLVLYEGNVVKSITVTCLESESIELPRATDEQMEEIRERFAKWLTRDD